MRHRNPARRAKADDRTRGGHRDRGAPEIAGLRQPAAARDDLAFLVVGATAILGEAKMHELRRRLVLMLGLPCGLAPLIWWLVSGGELPGNEMVVIVLACVCLAAALHDTMLLRLLAGATEGRESEARAAAEAAEAAAVQAWWHASPGAGWQIYDEDDPLDSRFVQRRSDLQLEAQLKSSARGRGPRRASV